MKTKLHCVTCGKKSVYWSAIDVNIVVCTECCSSWLEMTYYGKVDTPKGLEEIRKLREEEVEDDN